VQDVIARLQRLPPKNAEMRESLAGLFRYYSENAGRMRYDEYLRLGYGIGAARSSCQAREGIRMRSSKVRLSCSNKRRSASGRRAPAPLQRIPACRSRA
jgi:hypothetical protein